MPLCLTGSASFAVSRPLTIIIPTNVWFYIGALNFLFIPLVFSSSFLFQFTPALILCVYFCLKTDFACLCSYLFPYSSYSVCALFVLLFHLICVNAIPHSGGIRA